MLKKKFSARSMRVYEDIAYRVRCHLPGASRLEMLAACILLLVAGRQRGSLEYWKLMREIPQEVADVLREYTKIDVSWRELRELVGCYSKEELRDVLLNAPMEEIHSAGEDFSLHPCLQELVTKILELPTCHSFLHFRPSNATYLSAVAQLNPVADLYGVNCWVDEYASYEAILRNYALDERVKYLPNAYLVKGMQRVDFKLPDNVPLPTVERAVSTHPLGMRSKDIIQGILQPLLNKFPYLKPGASFDWVANGQLLEALAPNGKAASFMSYGTLYTRQDWEARRYAIERGFVETVILLPPRLYGITSQEVALVILSHNNNKVRFIDARQFYQKGRRRSEMSSEDVERIVTMYTSPFEEACSLSLSYEEIRKQDYSLLYEQYVELRENGSSQGEALDNLVEFLRSLPLRAEELDNLAQIDGELSYLQVSDVEAGGVRRQLPRMRMPNVRNCQQLLLRDKDILLSRQASLPKVGVYSATKGEHVLPVGGNLYVLRVRKDRVNPLYLAAYLQSEKGRASLKRQATGVVAQIISSEKLRTMLIPLPSREEQDAIAARYEAVRQRVTQLMQELEEAQKELEQVIGRG